MRRSTRSGLLCILALSSATLAPAQSDATFRNYITPRCQQFSDEALAWILGEAQRDGVIRTPAEAARFKEVLQDTLGKKGGLPRPGTAAAGFALPTAMAPELEYNDSSGFADTIGANATTTAALSGFSDRDVYRMTLVADSDVVVAVAGASGNAPLMNLSDADGRHIANAVATPPTRSIRTTLPAGEYQITVGSNSAPQGYTLTTSSTATVIPALVPGPTPQSDVLSRAGELRTWQLILPQDAQVQILATGGASLDLALTFGRRKGGRIFFVDDYGAGSTDPRLTTTLPAGTYYAFFHEVQGRAGAFSITTTTTNAAMPAVQCGNNTPGNIADKGTRDLFRVFLPTADRITLLTSRGGAAAINDAIMELYDSDMGELIEDDDDGAILHPRLEQPLPAGLYYAVVRGFNANVGTYDITANCGVAPVWLPLSATQTTVMVTAGSAAAFQITPGTTCPLQFGFADQIGRITVMDGVGKLRFHIENAHFVPTFGPGDPFRGGATAIGMETLYVLVRVLYNNAYTSPMTIEAPLWTSPTGVLNSLGKAGVFHVLIAGRSAAPTPVPLLPPFSGNLLFDPTRLFLVVDAQPLGSNGRYTWPFSIGGYGGVLQAIAIDLNTLTGAATNLIP